ncbi:unknown [Sinorhizobium phage PBC5]|nr:unknown [Sinorhizobium phage PBC5]
MRGSATENVPWPGDFTLITAPLGSSHSRTPYCWYSRLPAGPRGSATENDPAAGRPLAVTAPAVSSHALTPCAQFLNPPNSRGSATENRPVVGPALPVTVREVSSHGRTPRMSSRHPPAGIMPKSRRLPSSTASLLSERQSEPASTKARRTHVFHCSEGTRCRGPPAGSPGSGSFSRISPTPRRRFFSGS